MSSPSTFPPNRPLLPVNPNAKTLVLLKDGDARTWQNYRYMSVVILIVLALVLGAFGLGFFLTIREHRLM